MAPSKSQYHVRSNSFPTRPHPLFQECDEHLHKLGFSDSAFSSSSSISHKMSGLEDLHDCVEKVFQLPMTQQAFVRGRGEKWVDELVDGSLRLLDTCSTAKDATLHTKECAREIQSIMRRRRRSGGDQVGLGSEVNKYFASRKVVKKAVRKALDSNSKASSKSVSLPPNKDSVETMALFGVLREVEAVTLSVFESLLCFVSGMKTQSRARGWSLVSKLVYKKKVGCNEEEVEVNEFANVDEALQGFETSKFENATHVETVQNELQSLESCAQDFEERLERLFRRLIKTRVALLNILNY